MGAGGLGSASLLYLAAAGVGRLGVADGERVCVSPLDAVVDGMKVRIADEKSAAPEKPENGQGDPGDTAAKGGAA